jgi:hypothetical protein
MHGPDMALAGAVVVESAPRRADRARHGRVGNETALPDGADQFILRDDTVPAFDQVDKQVQHHRLDPDRLARRHQLPGRRIDDE